MIKMRIAIIGSGAMGSLYGGILAEAGNEVYFIDVFEEHINKINNYGLCIVENGVERYIKNVKATINAKEIGKVDLAIVFVKSTITDIAIKQNKDVLDKNTIVLTLQNGLGNIEKINSVVDISQIVAGTSSNGASMIEPGKINHAGNGGTTIGEIDGSMTERIKELGKILNIPKLGPVKISDNVMGTIWDKLLVNAGINPLTAITGLKNGQLLENEESILLLDKLINEGVEVAKGLGIKLGFEDSEYCKNVCKATSKNTSSMLADVINKRNTEIMNINGAIVREGRKLNIQTPANEMMTYLVLLKEKCY
ncbi:ketopantoate reductase family protein [Tissierella praeacuta]|uniref:ketopantoate reductase family protein n=1 Tax=Tissierella praeacuta TaxID=43131 RepID=UPI001FD34814|nr:2-dehydropantoate 2-reductase [Tissierella praeacuta]